MAATLYPEINNLLDMLLARMQAVLGKRLAGLYLFGSLVWGDFDYEASDIDLLAVTTTGIDDNEFTQLEKMHNEVAGLFPAWYDRIEIAYQSLEALRTFKTVRSPIAVISPGEPFNLKEAGRDWLLNWYVVQEKGRALYGPAPGTLIDPISKEEYVQAVREQAEEWRDYIIHTRHSRSYQGYAILTMCRALYAIKNGEQVSKNQAARWAQQHLPEWSDQIQKALQWRQDHRNRQIDPEATYPETVKFVTFVIDCIKAENRPVMPGN
jgi:predicted nucleotidyltransferase